MTRVLTVQPAAYTDNLWAMPDGQIAEGTRLPYPFHVTEDGRVQRQDFWRGDPERVIGFAARVDVHSIDLRWADAWREPQRAVGMYLVTASSAGQWSTHQTAVESVTEVPA